MASNFVLVNILYIACIVQTTWLYLAADVAVVQLNTESCLFYTKCINCIRDPHCGWNTTSEECQHYRPGYDVLSYGYWIQCRLKSDNKLQSLNAQ